MTEIKIIKIPTFPIYRSSVHSQGQCPLFPSLDIYFFWTFVHNRECFTCVSVTTYVLIINYKCFNLRKQ